MYLKKTTIASTESCSEKIGKIKDCINHADAVVIGAGAGLSASAGLTYDNKDIIFEMVEKQKDFKIPTELIPLCPRCGKPMTTNLRKDNSFVEDSGWHNAMNRYSNFITENKDKKIVFLELGVGFNTPSIIKYPFWQMTYNNKNATFISINAGEPICAKEIVEQSILIEDDICVVMKLL